jgi:hypothetical protein
MAEESSPEPPTPPPLSPEMLEYRRTLQAAEDASHNDYDKAILTLSGGALGITFAFFREIAARLGDARPIWLIAAWAAWCLSLASILSSFYTAGKANRLAIQQINRNQLPDKPGGSWDRATRRLNFSGGVCFLLGAVFAVCFIWQAFGIHEKRPPPAPPATTSQPAASASAQPAASP